MIGKSDNSDHYLNDPDWVPLGQALMFLTNKGATFRSWHESALIDDLPTIGGIVSEYGKEYLDKLLLALSDGQIQAKGMLSVFSFLHDSPFPYLPEQTNLAWSELLDAQNLPLDQTDLSMRVINIPKGCWSKTSIAKNKCGKLVGSLINYSSSENFDIAISVSKICISKHELEELSKRPKPRAINNNDSKLPRTIARMLYGMAVKNYNYDETASKSSVTGQIKHDLDSLGIPVDEKTIRAKLREASAKVNNR